MTLSQPTHSSLVLPLDHLRHATSDAHQSLEANIDWQRALATIESYRDLLLRFQSVVRPLEQSIDRWLGIDPPPDYRPGVRGQWLMQDLAVLDQIGSLQAADEFTSAAGLEQTAQGTGNRGTGNGGDANQGDANQGDANQGDGNQGDGNRGDGNRGDANQGAGDEELDFVNSLPAAIGAQYVLEGSSLGGQFLSRQLENSLGLKMDRGGAYFAAYGAAVTMTRWKAFKQWANERLQRIDHEAIGRSLSNFATSKESPATVAAVSAATRVFRQFEVAVKGMVDGK